MRLLLAPALKDVGDEASHACQSAGRGGEIGEGHRPDMRDTRLNIQFAADARSRKAFGQREAVIAQDFVGSGLDLHRGKSRQVPQQRRCQWIVGRDALEIGLG